MPGVLWATMKISNLYNMGISEGEEKEDIKYI